MWDLIPNLFKSTNLFIWVQDLPNNMIHQVPIKSLPQEWLWCETWCDDASKKSAKTIDLVTTVCLCRHCGQGRESVVGRRDPACIQLVLTSSFNASGTHLISIVCRHICPEYRLYIQMDDVNVPKMTLNHLNRPLVVGSSIGFKFLLINYIR